MYRFPGYVSTSTSISRRPISPARLSLAGLEVEGIEKVGGDEILNIAITPDAARALSVIGVAREVAAILDKSVKLPADEFPVSGDDSADKLAGVSIEDPNLCQRYIAVILKDVQIRESPPWMKDRLERAGVRAVTNVVDVTNYVMLEWGQPLHAFDYRALQLRAGAGQMPQITVRSGETRRKDENPRWNRPKSRSIHAHDLRRSRPHRRRWRHGRRRQRSLPANARHPAGSGHVRQNLGPSHRAEAEDVDRSELPLHAGDSSPCRRSPPDAAKLIAELGGGRIVPGVVDRYPVPQEQVTAYISPAQVRRTLGLNLSLDEIAGTLSRLEFVVQKRADLPPNAGEGATALFVDPKEDVLKCAVPWYRLDVRIPADLTEEIARMRGFDNIGMTNLSEPLPRPVRNPVNETEEKIRDILTGCGLQETINYSLTTPEQHEKLGFNASATFVTLANPMSVDRTVMRRSLLVSAVENLAYNIRFTNRLATFEVGRVYLPEQSLDGVRPLEDRRVSLLVTGPRREVNLNPDPAGAEAMDFFDLKGVIETLLSRLGIAAHRIKFAPHRQDQTFTPRCAKILLDQTELGVMGELNPTALASFGIKSDRVAAAELRIAPLIQTDWDGARQTTVNKSPAVIEDLAFTVADTVGAGDLRDTILRAGGGKVVDVELFDVFRGGALGEGKVLAYRVTYQAPGDCR